MASLFTPEERLMTPPRLTGVDESLPVVFIGGPVEGAPDFQTPLARRLIAATDDVFVASPRLARGYERPSTDKLLLWHQANLGRAAFNGVTAFWFAARDSRIPNESGEKYAHAAAFDFLWAIGQREQTPGTKVELGIHLDYHASGARSEPFLRRLAQQANLVVHTSIDDLETAILDDLA